jgi:anti-sigma-K factor RskA
MKNCKLNEEQKESMVAYLLGELPASAAQVLEQHLAAGCSRCEREIGELGEAFSMLAYSVPLASPSPTVRERLFARLSEDLDSNPPLPARTTQVPWYRSATSWLVRIAASLVILMLVAETVYLINIKQKTHQLELANAQLLEQVIKKQNLITTMSESRRVIVLDGRFVKASGKAYWDTDKNTWLFYIDKLPPAPKGKVYQLWFITKEETVGGDTFQTDSNGRAQLRQNTPNKANAIVATAVSLEPEGGSSQPKGVIYLLGPVLSGMNDM